MTPAGERRDSRIGITSWFVLGGGASIVEVLRIVPQAISYKRCPKAYTISDSGPCRRYLMRGAVIYDDVAGDNKVEIGRVMRGCGCQEEEK